VPDDWTIERTVPFSSLRRWSAASFEDHGAWILGAPDALLDPAGDDVARARVVELAGAGRRLLLLARVDGGLHGQDLPPALEPVALAVLEERIRPDAASTLRYFADQGVEVKLISGDHPRTVASIAERVGVATAGAALDARKLPADISAMADAVERHTIFGRVGPEQKRTMIAALQSRGHVVAMTGDGVNDVMALKDADIGVAMGSGSEAARAVAQFVLLDNSFAVLPGVVAEGRRVIANVERVANLFVTKTIYAMLLALTVGVARLPFPFFPRHLTIVSSLTIGIPAFFLALAPNTTRARPGFVARVLSFAVPAGLVAATATFVGYGIARAQPHVTLAEARTTATIVLFAVTVWVLHVLATPRTPLRRLLVACMVGAFLVVLTIPWLRDVLALDLPGPQVTAMALVCAGTADLALVPLLRLSRAAALRFRSDQAD
jgi:magnesium-transporting ATPase (P-type)